MLPRKSEAFPETLEGTEHTWGRERAATRTPTGDPRKVASSTATSPKVMPKERSCSSNRGNMKLFYPPTTPTPLRSQRTPAVRSTEHRSYQEPNPPRPPGRRPSPGAWCPCLPACWCRSWVPVLSASVLGCSLRRRLRDQLLLIETAGGGAGTRQRT